MTILDTCHLSDDAKRSTNECYQARSQQNHPKGARFVAEGLEIFPRTPIFARQKICYSGLKYEGVVLKTGLQMFVLSIIRGGIIVSPPLVYPQNLLSRGGRSFSVIKGRDEKKARGSKIKEGD